MVSTSSLFAHRVIHNFPDKHSMIGLGRGSWCSDFLEWCPWHYGAQSKFLCTEPTLDSSEVELSEADVQLRAYGKGFYAGCDKVTFNESKKGRFKMFSSMLLPGLGLRKGLACAPWDCWLFLGSNLYHKTHFLLRAKASLFGFSEMAK